MRVASGAIAIGELKSLEEYNLTSYIIISVIQRVKEGAERGRGLERVISNIEREVSVTLREISEKRHIGSLLSEAAKYYAVLEREARKVYSEVRSFEARVSTRLVVHARSPYMPLDIGVAWHPYFNLPYIPATSLKGAVRAYALRKGWRGPGGLNPEKLFGDTEGEGLVVFFDSLPIECRGRLLEADVITPHYSEATGRIRETDVRPVPIVFPVVANGAVFKFVLGFRGEAAKHADSIVSLVKEALREGLGAKTLLGYGVFREKEQ